MINNQRVLAIIPARGGSKRLPRKNALALAGKPLICWSIEAAKKSRYVDKIFVSTDDPEIASLAETNGIHVPELRPDTLASDTATTESVLAYTLERFGQGIDIILLLQPTSPLRTSQHIDEALELYLQNKAQSVISVTACEHSPLWTNTLPKNLSLKGFIKEHAKQRAQDLEPFYRLNGAIYVLDAIEFTKNRKIDYGEHSFAYKMNNEDSIDIDTELDFRVAEIYLNKRLDNP